MKLKEKISKNKKIQKLKEKKEAFDVIWSNPKSHAIIMLSFWFIVVLILSLMVRTKDNTALEIPEETLEIEEKTLTSDLIKEKLEQIKNYEASILVNEVNYIHIIKVNNEELIEYNNETYYHNDLLYILNNSILEPIENDFINDIVYFSISNIYNLVKDIDEDYITIYKDNSYIIKYSVDISNYKSDLEGNLEIILTGSSEINKIEINSDYKIIIDLTNVNNIEKLNINVLPQEGE